MAKIEMTLEQAKSLLGKDKDLDVVLVSNFPELKGRPKSWEELKRVRGFFLDTDGEIESHSGNTREDNKIIFATEKQAKSALAAAQLSQLMKAYNGNWVADWGGEIFKYVIYRVSNGIKTGDHWGVYHFLAFPTAELRDEFLSNFEPLIKEYFEL